MEFETTKSTVSGWSLWVVCGALLLAGVPTVQVPSCAPGTPLDKQNRTQMKHRSPAPPSVRPVAQTVSGMIGLAVPTITTLAERDQETALSPQEDEVLELTGDLWHVKLASDDCDFHLELSAPGGSKNDQRVIVEIPQGPAFDSARMTLVAALNKKGIRSLKVDVPYDLPNPLRTTVTGYAFLDAWHFSSKDPKRGHAHGTAKVATLWEIHPVWKIVPSP